MILATSRHPTPEEWTYRAPLSAEAQARLDSIPNPWAVPGAPQHQWVLPEGVNEREARRAAERAERWMEAYGVPMDQGVPGGMGPPPAEQVAGGGVGVGVGADEHAADPAGAYEDEEWEVSPEMQQAWDDGLPSEDDGAGEEDWDY